MSHHPHPIHHHPHDLERNSSPPHLTATTTKTTNLSCTHPLHIDSIRQSPSHTTGGLGTAYLTMLDLLLRQARWVRVSHIRPAMPYSELHSLQITGTLHVRWLLRFHIHPANRHSPEPVWTSNITGSLLLQWCRMHGVSCDLNTTHLQRPSQNGTSLLPKWWFLWSPTSPMWWTNQQCGRMFSQTEAAIWRCHARWGVNDFSLSQTHTHTLCNCFVNADSLSVADNIGTVTLKFGEAKFIELPIWSSIWLTNQCLATSSSPTCIHHLTESTYAWHVSLCHLLPCSNTLQGRQGHFHSLLFRPFFSPIRWYHYQPALLLSNNRYYASRISRA